MTPEQIKIKAWNGLSYEQWSETNKKIWVETLEGKRTFVLPDKFYSIPTDFGGFFIQLQSACLLNEPPGVFVRDCYYGRALKVLLPKHAKTGDNIRIIRKSQSGKSYIAEVVPPTPTEPT